MKRSIFIFLNLFLITPLFSQPTVSLSAPTSITSTGFTLNGTVNNNGNGSGTISRMMVGLSSGVYDSSGTTPGSTGNKITGSVATSVFTTFPTVKVTTILPNTIYYYCLSASNGVGYVRSSESFFRTLPSNPTGLSITGGTLTDSSLSLTWNNTNSDYRLLAKTGSFSSSSSDGTILYEGSSTSYNVSGLDESTTYYFTLYARSSDITPVFSASNATVSTTTLSSSLPVELSSFSYSDGMLKWQTKTETNNYGWEVELNKQTSNVKDQNDAFFEKIGFVAGKGTTTSPQNYSFAIQSTFTSKIGLRLRQIDTDGKFIYSNILSVDLTPEAYGLNQNIPNPFNPSTLISYQLKASGFVSLKVFDLLGREVQTLVNENKPSGIYDVKFDASQLSSGVYIYQLKSGNVELTKKMFLMK